ncbi:DNA-J related domain-containing protein [Marinobacterium weihaiense]|uniref:DnaJ domain-containing protein n=1 Tax=Marinobacterium weihaiense TaxID=2851016 RepID=A0ABS6M8K6_9GAMM|nr:DNA-J related domain-containing protein [Marinobacterium weihaiense]MBV0932624.1 DnaJ domain-containing protein [Marinobacterium weihaiense]
MTPELTSNPLIPELMALLRHHPEGISEFSLMKALEAHPAFADLADDYQLCLFQKHFMIMHGLYTLQIRLWHEERLRVEISPLSVRLYEDDVSAPVAGTAPPDTEDPLRSYYLDWQQLGATSAEDVQRLLQGFFEHWNNPGARSRALATLALEEGASQAEIRSRYRQLAARLHPDKGGDSEAFIEVRRAYELLRGTDVNR